MTWRHYLQVQTRNPAFLWRMVIGILVTGVVVGLVVDAAMPARASAEAAADDSDEFESIDPHDDQLDTLADQSRWRELWRAIPREMLAEWRSTPLTVLAVLTGVCWMAFVLQAIQIRGRGDHRLWAPLIGLGLGVLSVWPTLFFIYWQEQQWGLLPSAELQDGVRFFLLGVGLREELAKFVCFLPLLPLVVLRRDELAALLAAGSVGLGFAMEENVGYVARSAGIDTLGRLLSAAPFHMSATALLGLAAYRACVWPKVCGPQLIAMLVILVVAHGMYDAFIVIPALPQFNLAAGLISIALLYQFFRELRGLHKPRRDPISLTANFLFCVSTVAAATFVCLAGMFGWEPALDALALGVITQAISVYLFLREMPETMVSV